MKVLYKEPFKNIFERDVPNTLEALQSLVGGYIEPVTLDDSCVMLCNEEGKFSNLQANFRMNAIDDFIFGPVVFLGTEGEEFCDIDDFHADKIRESFTKGGRICGLC